MESANKKRSANYTAREKELLISLAAKYKEILENKKTDSVSVSEKNESWRKIEAEFNLVAPNLCFRSGETLKKLYENLKKELRKKVAEEKKEVYLTGGGSFTKVIKNDTDDLLLNIINGKTVFGLENPFDSDLGVANITTDEKNAAMTTGSNDFENSDTELNSNIAQVASSRKPTKSNWAHFKANDLRRPISNNLISSRTIAESTENNIEIVYADVGNRSTEEVESFDKDKSTNRKRPSSLSEGTRRKNPASRRRPHSTIQLTSASTLYDKYEQLVDKKIVNEDFSRQASQMRMTALQRKNELEIQSLELEIEIKKQQLDALKKN